MRNLELNVKLQVKKNSKKTYKSCKAPSIKITNNKLIKFANNAECKYQPIIKKFILNLFKCKNNPNKSSINNK